jgi:diguanylate cyclase (GGDEF)-like protein/PAS domain S-box-containing protein
MDIDLTAFSANILNRESLESRELSVQWSRTEMLGRLARREAMLRACSYAAAQFLGHNWNECITRVLESIGRASDVSRMYVFSSYQRDEKWYMSQCYEWSAEGVELRVETKDYKDVDLVAVGLRRWAEILSQGGVICSPVSELPEPERSIIEKQEIASVAVVPIQVDGQWWGMLGFDDCREGRIWDKAEIEVLHLVGDMIGAAIKRGQADTALRESEGELRALLNSMHDAIFVLDHNGIYQKVVSSEPSLLYQPAEELRGASIETTIGGDLGREFMGIIRDVLGTRSLRKFEYKLHFSGRDTWFSASVTPLGRDTVLWVARDITEAQRARDALGESEARFRLLAENSTDKIARISMEGKFLYTSPSVEPLLGYDPEELVGTQAFDMVHPEDQHLLVASYNRLVAAPTAGQLVTYRMRRKDGRYIWFETTSRIVAGSSFETSEIHSVSRDISARVEAQEALRFAEAKYRSIFENAVEGIFQTTADGTYVDANPSLARIYGYETPEELKKSLTDIGSQLYADPRRRLDFVSEMMEKGSVSNFEAQIRRKDGDIIWISENARAVKGDNGELLLYEGTVEDITARKTAEEQLLHDALHDKLTGLANRALFLDRLQQAFGRMKRHPESLFAVLFLDFDRFKNVNDSLGHQAGDQLLISFSNRLKKCLRPGDTVARQGGDEFAILLEDIDDVAGATLVAERIQEEMARPFSIIGQEIFSSVSIGIAIATPEYEAPEDLIRDSDMAMYRAKALGKARHEVFDIGMHTRAVALLQLETDLRWAIEREEFELYYQPIISLDSGKICGFEALIRWQHPERGMVSPIDFIPVAEETGWIVPIGRWVLEQACAQLAQWQKQVPSAVQLTMSVNLSSKQFSQLNLIPEIEDLLARHQIPAGCLKLEITESAIMENADEVTERLLSLRALGVKLGLDDFGTGYSSLSYLHRFPLDTLKIDRSFIARMNEDGENREIVRTILSLGKNLGMDVVAEGVEETAQLADLRSLNCEHGQGFFFARPMTSADARILLDSTPVW